MCFRTLNTTPRLIRKKAFLMGRLFSTNSQAGILGKQQIETL
jgi:hypothetical protein